MGARLRRNIEREFQFCNAAFQNGADHNLHSFHRIRWKWSPFLVYNESVHRDTPF